MKEFYLAVKALFMAAPATKRMNEAQWRFYRWLLVLIHDAEQVARCERLTGLPAYHDAITGDLLWSI